MPVALHVWADASTDQKLGIAFGAFVIGTGEPTVKRLRSKTPTDAEFELMTKAASAAPVGSILFTDLSNWQGIVNRWNYWQLSQFKAIVERKEIEVRYAAREERADAYFECHKAAISAVRAARKMLTAAERSRLKKRKEH